jgi:chromate reductase, NAD(P)H dehydrogenase (quinone)
MITIISATGRHDSMTLRVARKYEQLFREKGEEAHLVSLQGKVLWERSHDLHELEHHFLIPAQKFVFVMPEYNGSYPGILKVMIDNSDIKKCWWGKKAMLTGVADGRAGNLRGLDHFTNVLNYLRVNVLYNKIPLSRINTEIDQDGNLLQDATRLAIRQQIDEFMLF